MIECLNKYSSIRIYMSHSATHGWGRTFKTSQNPGVAKIGLENSGRIEFPHGRHSWLWIWQPSWPKHSLKVIKMLNWKRGEWEEPDKVKKSDSPSYGQPDWNLCPVCVSLLSSPLDRTTVQQSHSRLWKMSNFDTNQFQNIYSYNTNYRNMIKMNIKCIRKY